MKLRIGTRESKLAQAQVAITVEALHSLGGHRLDRGDIEIVPIKTEGDRKTDITLADIGGKGLFVKEIEEALLDEEIDIAVHSMKDMTNQMPDGLTIAAVLMREDVRDALVSHHATSIAGLPQGARVGTSSLRRQAQLLHRRPDLTVLPLRGNVQTRLAKLDNGEVDATLLAVAGLKRLGLEERIACAISPEEMLPGAAQGAIALQCREGDIAIRELLMPLNHPETELCVTAEREMLAMLDGNCRTPIAALAELLPGSRMRLRGLVATPDGKSLVAAETQGLTLEATALGRALGQELLERMGKKLLSQV